MKYVLSILEKTRFVMMILSLVIIVFSSFVGIYDYLETLFSKKDQDDKHIEYYELRIFISESLVLALTFLLGADIIESMFRSNLKTLIRLIVVFVFRLAITYIVNKDIGTLEEERKKLNKN